MSKNISEESAIELSQLRWHCRRGVKELDVVLSNYLDNHYLKSDLNLQLAFKTLLKLEDPILMSFILDYQQNDDTDEKQVLEKMKKPFSK